MREFILNLDRLRKLNFGFRACRLIREKFGDKEINEILDMKVDEMPLVAWAGLVWEDPNLTPERAEEIIEQAIYEGKTRIIEVLNTLTACLQEQFGAQKKTTGSTDLDLGSSGGSPSGSGSPTGNLTS